MKRYISLLVAGAFFLAILPPLHAAEEIRPLGMYSATGGTSGDLRIGNTCVTSTGGRLYCGVNTRHLLFFDDNTVTVDMLYPLASADTGFPYVLGGTWAIDNVAAFLARLGTGTADNTTYLRGDGTWAEPPGTGTGDGDMLMATYDADEDGVVDSAIATAIEDGLIVDADINSAADIDGSKMLDNSVTAAKLQASSGTADNTTFYRGDGTWTAISASPQGDTGQIQYNDGGSLAAVPGTGYSSGDNTLTVPPLKTPSLTTDQTATGGTMTLREGSGNGTEYVQLKAADSLSDNLVLTLPTADGTNGQALVTNGSGVLSFAGVAATSIPQGSNPTVDAAGEIAVDTTADQIVYYGGAERVLSYVQPEHFTIKGYTAADDNVVSWQAFTNITLTQLSCRTHGTDNVTVTLYECDANGASCSTTGLVSAATSTTATDSSASNGTIDENDWITVSLSSIQGTATAVSCTVRYTITRQ